MLILAGFKHVCLLVTKLSKVLKVHSDVLLDAQKQSYIKNFLAMGATTGCISWLPFHQGSELPSVSS